MTEKRFKMNVIEEELYPMPVYYNNHKELEYNEVCDLLNELHEENERLKKQINELINGIQETSKMSANAITKQWSEDKYL
jgi:hypothetical protein